MMPYSRLTLMIYGSTVGRALPLLVRYSYLLYRLVAGVEQGWEYLGTHPLGKSYLVVSYLGKDKSYLVSKLVVCIVVSPALTGKTYVSRILGRILGSILLVLPAQIPPVCGCATSSNVPLMLKRC